jgi:hypothetical protein
MGNLTLIRGRFGDTATILFSQISDMIISSGLKCAIIGQDTKTNQTNQYIMDRRGWDIRLLLSNIHSESTLRLDSLRERALSGEVDFIFVTEDVLLSDMHGQVLDFPCDVISLVPEGDDVVVSDYGADVIKLEKRHGKHEIWKWNWRGVEYDDNISLATAFAREKKIEKII